MPTDPSLLLLGLGEARFENSLWTSFDFDLDGIDVGAGSRTVWVARPSGGMWKIDSWSPAQPQLVSFPHGIKRISVSRPPSGTYQQEDPWVVASDGSVWLNTLGSWMMLSDDDTLDISAGHFSVYAAYPAVSDVAYRVTISGALETFYLTQAGSGWSPVPWYSPAPPATTTVALERQRLAPPYEAVWYVRADQHIGKLSNPLKDFGSLADDIIDVGAGAGVVWVVSGVQSPDAGARGNSIWRLDPSAPAGKGWDRLSPGWAVAVDADEDGNAWVLDSDGRLHVRGARMPAVFDNFRGKPKPGESWDEYFQLLTSTPGLYPELVIQSRLAGAGGTVVLRAWDDYAGLSPAAKTLYKSVLAVLLEKDRGIELLFCIAPIFTGALRVPPNLRVGATKTDDGTYIDFTLLLSAYLDVVKDLATVPGFVERVRYLSLGNEVDYYLSQWADGTKAWTTYFEFCAGVIQALRSVLPRTKFGVTWTVAGIQKHPAQWSKLMKSCDALFVNYYAVDLTGPAPTYQVKTLEQYGADFKKLIELADTYGGGKPIVLQEVGMPTDSLLGGSNFAQAKFIEFLLQQWDAVGIRIRFLSWFLLYDYLYDPTLKVSLVDPANANSPIQVDVSAYPKSFMTPPLPFWGEAHNIPGLFLGPYAPPKTSGLVTNADRVYWLNQSTTDGTHAQRLTRFLASCGLLAADGQPKHLPTLKLPPGVQNPSSGWDAFRFGLEQRRRQT